MTQQINAATGMPDPRLTYLEFLAMEARLLRIELYGSDISFTPCDTPAHAFHFPTDGRSWKDVPVPGTRAVQVLRTVGIAAYGGETTHDRWRAAVAALDEAEEAGHIDNFALYNDIEDALNAAEECDALDLTDAALRVAGAVACLECDPDDEVNQFQAIALLKRALNGLIAIGGIDREKVRLDLYVAGGEALA